MTGPGVERGQTARRWRAARGALVVVVFLATAACASALSDGLRGVDRFMVRASRTFSYATWQHLNFSARMNVQSLAGDPVATPEDAATAAQQGGWWGDEVPVVSSPRRDAAKP